MRHLDNNGHSVFLLYYHLVLVVKYRRKVIDDAISDRAKGIFLYISENYGITLEEWNHDRDHVHIMFRANPNSELSKFINAYKSASSRLLKKEYPQIREKLWKDAFWSQSFCLLTTGGAPIETVRRYIETQGGTVMRNIAYQYRLYPTDAQKTMLKKTFGCCRFIYNRMLSDKKAAYEKEGKMPRITPARYKKEYEWLKEVVSLALANVQLHLEKAYQRFFDSSANGYPQYKCKRDPCQSYTTNVVNGNIRIEGNRIRLPKVGMVKIRLHRKAPEEWKLKSVTVRMEASGEYYASLLYEETCPQSAVPCGFDPESENQAFTGKDQGDIEILGIDYAMHGLAVFSDGTRADYPGYYRKGQEKLAREQRRLSRCRKGSSNYEKQRRKVAKCHRKVRNQRKDFQHKLSRRIVDRYDAVAVEDIDMKGMSRNLHFGKSVMDNGYGMFRDLLGYKLERQGKKLIKIDRFYPSSKRCSCCGVVKKELRLEERIYICTCGNRMDRDVNAAVNIREEGRRLLGA